MYEKILAAVEAVFDNAATPEEIASAVAHALKGEADDLNFLSALQAAGVDNWENYSEAFVLMEELEDE